MQAVLNRRRQGYAFPMALAAIIIITLVVGVAASQVQQAIETYSRQTEALEQEVLARSAEQTFLYHALTSPMGNLGVEIGGANSIDRLFSSGPTNMSGVDLLRANGQPRLFRDRMVLRYIDQQGFFDSISLGYTGQERDMAALGANSIRLSSLGAALRDYQDQDSIRSPGGAEATGYERDGLPPNRPLLDPMELCDVAGWSQVAICQDTGRLLLLTMPRGSAQLNPQLTSPFMLEALTGSRQAARRAHLAFEDGTFSRFADINDPQRDTVTDIFQVPGGATAKFALVVHDRSAQTAWISVYELTPQSVFAPFSLAYRYRIGGQYVRDALETSLDDPIEPLPDPGQ